MQTRSQGEQKFIDQYTRKFLVEWARCQILDRPIVATDNNRIYVTYATSKGWLSKDSSKVTSKGFGVAASFLK